jgi:putative YhbY family RNA-binding protein
MPAPLTPARRSEAHKLKPVVMIGAKNGLTDEVVAEIERALKAHELVKVKAFTDDREAREAWLAAICERLEAHPVQQIGKVLVVYRENPEKRPAPKPVAPPKAKPAAKPKPRKRPPRTAEGAEPTGRARLRKPKETVFTGTSRRRSRTLSGRPASGPPKRRPRTSR